MPKILLYLLCCSVVFFPISYGQNAYAQKTEIIDWKPFFLSGNIGSIHNLITQNHRSPDNVDQKGRTLLRLAVKYKQQHITLYLLEAGANVNQPSQDGLTPLHVAAYSHDIEHVKILLKHNADPNFANLYGETPLYSAIFYGYSDIAVLMIEAGGEITIKNNDGDSPLTHAPEATKIALKKFLEAAQPKKEIIKPKIIQNKPKITEPKAEELVLDKPKELSKIDKQKLAWQAYVKKETAKRVLTLKNNTTFIDALINPKRRAKKAIRKQLVQENISIREKKGKLTFQIILMRNQKLPKLSPVSGFVPVAQKITNSTKSETLAQKLYQGALLNYLNLLDKKPTENTDPENIASDNPTPDNSNPDNSTPDNSAKWEKLKTQRIKTLDYYTALLAYDALILAIKNIMLDEIAYDSAAQILTIKILENNKRIQETFEIKDILPTDAETLIANPDDLNWNFTYEFIKNNITRTQIEFLTPTQSWLIQ